MLKSIPIAKYFEIQNQEYVYLKLIPSKSGIIGLILYWTL